MRQIIVRANEAGQRLDKFLQKYMKEAPTSFFYKMMRKKNILLNEKKCAGSEKLTEGDCIRLYLAEETLEKFGAPVSDGADISPYEKAYASIGALSVLWENEYGLAVNKPAGILSQKARPTDRSLNEWLVGYLLREGELTAADLATFRPSRLQSAGSQYQRYRPLLQNPDRFPDPYRSRSGKIRPEVLSAAGLRADGEIRCVRGLGEEGSGL